MYGWVQRVGRCTPLRGLDAGPELHEQADGLCLPLMRRVHDGGAAVVVGGLDTRSSHRWGKLYFLRLCLNLGLVAVPPVVVVLGRRSFSA